MSKALKHLADTLELNEVGWLVCTSWAELDRQCAQLEGYGLRAVGSPGLKVKGRDKKTPGIRVKLTGSSSKDQAAP